MQGGLLEKSEEERGRWDKEGGMGEGIKRGDREEGRGSGTYVPERRGAETPLILGIPQPAFLTKQRKHARHNCPRCRVSIAFDKKGKKRKFVKKKKNREEEEGNIRSLS